MTACHSVKRKKKSRFISKKRAYRIVIGCFRPQMTMIEQRYKKKSCLGVGRVVVQAATHKNELVHDPNMRRIGLGRCQYTRPNKARASIRH